MVAIPPTKSGNIRLEKIIQTAMIRQKFENSKILSKSMSKIETMKIEVQNAPY
jgi:hypothetical protein